jgi:hypothetical protein
VENQKELTKGRAALLFLLSALAALLTATQLDGWHRYAGFSLVGVGIFLAFIRWNRKS